MCLCGRRNFDVFLNSHLHLKQSPYRLHPSNRHRFILHTKSNHKKFRKRISLIVFFFKENEMEMSEGITSIFKPTKF